MDEGFSPTTLRQMRPVLLQTCGFSGMLPLWKTARGLEKGQSPFKRRSRVSHVPFMLPSCARSLNSKTMMTLPGTNCLSNVLLKQTALFSVLSLPTVFTGPVGGLLGSYKGYSKKNPLSFCVVQLTDFHARKRSSVPSGISEEAGVGCEVEEKAGVGCEVDVAQFLYCV